MLKLLLAKARQVFNNAEDDEEVVLVVNGRETKNTYPISAMGEPDNKSPEDWVCSIAFNYQRINFQGTLSFKTRKCEPFKL